MNEPWIDCNSCSYLYTYLVDDIRLTNSGGVYEESAGESANQGVGSGWNASATLCNIQRVRPVFERTSTIQSLAVGRSGLLDFQRSIVSDYQIS